MSVTLRAGRVAVEIPSFDSLQAPDHPVREYGFNPGLDKW